MNSQLDLDLYDRQIRTYGLEASSKIITSSVMIIGLAKGLGTEIGKNLTLCGIKNIYLYDTNNIDELDIETGIYYSIDDINKNRASVLLTKLKELNPYVSINTVNTFEKNQNVTIIINQNIDYILKISDYCRNNNSKLVVLYSGGLSGVLFVDAGLNHQINDLTGEIIDPVQISDISKSGVVTCLQNINNFQSNDIIKLDNLQGININEFKKEWKIKIINNKTFQLLDFTFDFDFKIFNGTVIYINKSIIINHQTFKNQITNLNINDDYSQKLINTYLKLYNSQNLINKIPFIWSNNIDTFMNDNNIILKDQARIFNYEFISVVSIMGSIASSEAIKLITNKYMPINQWFTWTDQTLLPLTKPVDYNNNSVYSILYGTEYEKKIINSNIFIVGSGAIGCEYLKNFAFMNISNNSNGKIIITDHDNIEKSNLNRQFLFKPHNVGNFKSKTAAENIKILKPNLNIDYLYQKVGNDNINFTNNIFDNNLTCVFNALDNIEARKFMDEQCFKYNIPLFEAGTNGVKGNTQPIIPFITELYSASSDPEQDKTYPLCTIKSFPNEIQHVVYWALDYFELFNRVPHTLNNWIHEDNYLSNLSDHEKSTAIDDIYKFIIENEFISIKSFIKYAINTFIECYYILIIKLLDIHKPNHEISSGILFWSEGKRCPKPIKFDSSNKLHLEYIESTIYILMKICNFKYEFKIDDFILDINEYSSTLNYDEIIKTFDIKDEIIKSLDIENNFKLDELHYYKNKEFIPQIFDKDNNWHMKWIASASNMRACNYEIINESQYTIKGIAGHIIPAIATTTSLVAGLITLEFLKYLLNKESETYKSTFINLAEPIIIYSDPISAPFIEVCGTQINSWVKFEYKMNNSTLKDFKNYYEDIFKLTIDMIVMDTCILYADFYQDDLNNKLYDIINKNIDNNSNKIILTLIAKDENIEIPSITITSFYKNNTIIN